LYPRPFFAILFLVDLIRKFKRRVRFALTAAQHSVNAAPKAESLEQFLAKAGEMNAPRILELGTKRSFAERSTRHDEWVPNASEFIGTDLEMDVDVDAMADVHKLSSFFGEESFDAIISCSSFEHFKYPQLAAHEIMRTLRIGGLLFIQTHHSYPLHAAPYDYYRFSTDALAALFGTRMGFEVIKTDYQFPVRLFADQDKELKFMPDYLNTQLFGIKRSATPAEYTYELDAEVDTPVEPH
jgi:SAM-dependent methyltransferase